MKQEHQERLAALAERLADVFLDEADPDQWSAADVPMRERTKQDRGNRQWDLKNANQVGLLFARTLELNSRAGDGQQQYGAPTDPPADAEAEIARHEKEAVALLERVSARRQV